MISHLGKYEVIKELGAGAISTVYRAKISNHPEVAAKVIDLRFKSTADVITALQEIRILSSINGHPNIVKLIECFVDEDKQLLW